MPGRQRCGSLVLVLGAIGEQLMRVALSQGLAQQTPLSVSPAVLAWAAKLAGRRVAAALLRGPRRAWAGQCLTLPWMARREMLLLAGPARQARL
jgi:hypothetical protein